MDAVIKIGGSVVQNNSIKKLCRALNTLIRDYSFVIVPGGGDYADLVRQHYRKYHVSSDTAHWMAILSENILGFFLLEQLTFGIPVFTISEISKAIENSRIPIFMPFQYLFEYDPLPHSWDVTSDSIAAHIAEILHAHKLILLKDVDGIYTHDPKQIAQEEAKLISEINLQKADLSVLHSCIDMYLPTILKKYHRSCFVVNGLYPDRLMKILRNEKSIYTKIFL